MTYAQMKAVQSRIEECAREMAAALLSAQLAKEQPLAVEQMREHLRWAAEHAEFADAKLADAVMQMDKGE